MVQVLQRQPTKWERGAGAIAGLAEGAGSLAGAWREAMNARNERQALQERFKNDIFGKIRNPQLQRDLLLGSLEQEQKDQSAAAKQAQLARLMQSDWFQSQPEDIKGILQAEANGEISAQTARGLINFAREKSSYGDLQKSLYPGEENIPGQFPFSGAPEKSHEQPPVDFGPEEAGGSIASPTGGPKPVNKPPKASKRNFAAEKAHYQRLRTSPNKAIRDLAESQLKSLQQEEQIGLQRTGSELQREKFEYEKAKPTVQRAEKLSEAIPNEKQYIEALQTALSKRDMSFFTRDNLAEMTGLPFLTPEGALMKSNIKEYFLGDVKGVGGKGLNQWLERQLNDAMLKIGRSNAANQIVLQGFKAKYDRNAAWLDTYKEVAAEQKSLYGHIMGDIGEEVNERVLPRYEGIQKSWEESINSIIENSRHDPNEFVFMTDPKGRRLEVPYKDVDKLKKLGAKLENE